MSQTDQTQEDDNKTVSTSYLFSKYTIWVLLAGLLAAIWFKVVPIIAVCSFLLLLTFLIRGWKSKSLVRVVPSMSISKNRMFAGEQFTAEASVLNDKWLPLVWLEWEIPKADGIAWGEEQREMYIVRFLWLLWYQRVSWVMQGTARKRGVYDTGTVVLRSGDGFRFAESEEIHALSGQLYVYPRLIPVRAPSFSLSLQWGMGGKRGGYLEDPLLLSGVREYQPGDEWHKVNWKASARTGKLQTNTYQPMINHRLFIYVDVRGFYVNETDFDDVTKLQKQKALMEEAFESMLSFVASLSVQYHEQNIHIGFASNARNHAGQRVAQVNPGPQLTPLLDQLAQMTSRPQSSGTAALNELLLGGKRAAPMFIFCEQIDVPLYQWYVQHRHEVPELRIFYRTESEHANHCMNAAHYADSLQPSRQDAAAKGL